MNRDTFNDLRQFARQAGFASPLQARILTFTAPRSAPMHAPIPLRWSTEHAERVQLTTVGDEGIRIEEVAPSSQSVARTSSPGLFRASLHCWEVGDAENAPPAVTASLTVQITAPPVYLDLSADQLRARPGAWVKLFWSTRDAIHVLLRRPLFSEEHTAGPNGAVDIRIDIVPDYFEIVAVGHANRRRSARCRLDPMHPMGGHDAPPLPAVFFASHRRDKE